MNIVLEMLLFFLSNANIYFDIKKLIQRVYTIEETILICRRVQLIDKNKFVKVVLDENFETFVIYVVALKTLKSPEIIIYLAHFGQILTEVTQLALVE